MLTLKTQLLSKKLNKMKLCLMIQILFHLSLLLQKLKQLNLMKIIMRIMIMP